MRVISVKAALVFLLGLASPVLTEGSDLVTDATTPFLKSAACDDSLYQRTALFTSFYQMVCASGPEIFHRSK